MFPLIGILVAAALLFKTRKKAPAAKIVVAATTKPAATVKASMTKASASTTKKPTKATKATKATAKATSSQTSIEGMPLPTAGQYTADVFGSMTGTNPQVLSPTLPYGYYSPGSNSAGTTPIVVIPTYRN